MKPLKVSARAAKGIAYHSPSPSLFRDHPRSRHEPMSDAMAVMVNTMTSSWAAHARAGEYPVIVGSKVEWRKSVTEVAA